MADSNDLKNQKTASGHSVESSTGEVLDVGSPSVVVDHGLHRALSERHLQMIALGGVVGYVCGFQEITYINCETG